LTKSDVDYTEEHWTNFSRLQILNFSPCWLCKTLQLLLW